MREDIERLSMWPQRPEEERYYSFEDAKRLAKRLRASGLVNNRLEYQRWIEKTPGTGLPPDPEEEYAEKGWKGWRDFLGIKILRYEAAKELLTGLYRQGVVFDKASYLKYRKNNLNLGLPNSPAQTYRSSLNELLGKEEARRELLEKLKELFSSRNININNQTLRRIARGFLDSGNGVERTIQAMNQVLDGIFPAYINFLKKQPQEKKLAARKQRAMEELGINSDEFDLARLIHSSHERENQLPN